MKKTLGKLWKFANTPVGDIFNLENLDIIASLGKDGMVALVTQAAYLESMTQIIKKKSNFLRNIVNNVRKTPNLSESL